MQPTTQENTPFHVRLICQDIENICDYYLEFWQQKIKNKLMSMNLLEFNDLWDEREFMERAITIKEDLLKRNIITHHFAKTIDKYERLNNVRYRFNQATKGRPEILEEAINYFLSEETTQILNHHVEPLGERAQKAILKTLKTAIETAAIFTVTITYFAIKTYFPVYIFFPIQLIPLDFLGNYFGFSKTAALFSAVSMGAKVMQDIPAAAKKDDRSLWYLCQFWKSNGQIARERINNDVTEIQTIINRSK